MVGSLQGLGWETQALVSGCKDLGPEVSGSWGIVRPDMKPLMMVL